MLKIVTFAKAFAPPSTQSLDCSNEIGKTRIEPVDEPYKEVGLCP